jgi:hypothetical protein
MSVPRFMTCSELMRTLNHVLSERHWKARKCLYAPGCASAIAEYEFGMDPASRML